MLFRYILIAALCVSLAIFLTSCGSESNKVSDRSNTEESSNLKNELQVLEGDILSKIKELGSKLETIESKIEKIEDIRFLDSLESVKREDFLNFKKETTDDILEIKQLIINSIAVFNLKENKDSRKLIQMVTFFASQ